MPSYVYLDSLVEETRGLCIYSNKGPGDDFTDHGHAGLVYYYSQGDAGMITTTYGLWPGTQDGSSIKTNNAGDTKLEKEFSYFYCQPISLQQKLKLDELVAAKVVYSCSNNCASFASDTFSDVTGTSVNADDNFGVEMPRAIGVSILELNGNEKVPKEGLPWEIKNINRPRRLGEEKLSLTSYPKSFWRVCVLGKTE